MLIKAELTPNGQYPQPEILLGIPNTKEVAHERKLLVDFSSKRYPKAKRTHNRS
jgi:hypothetical protein